MRLRKLSMMNIGPYAGRADLDFEELGDVFLVCGKTGSGKTTIFDAVSFALYGKALEKRDIASHFATPADDVSVDLDFESAGQRWRIHREPQRLVAKKNGKGTTEHPQAVVLWKWISGKWEPAYDKTTEVEAAVVGILGLSADEFTKIVLLPQGEFQRFLEMNTRDRTLILEKLFPVDVHGAVSELARVKAQEAEQTARDLDARMAAMEARLGAEPEAALERARAELAAAKLAETAAMAARDAAAAAALAAELGAKAWSELDEARAERAGLEATAAGAASEKARLSRAEAGLGAAPAVAAATRARLERVDAETSLNSANNALALADERQPEAEAAERRGAELAAGLEAMDREAGQLSARTAAWERLAAAETRLAAAVRARDAAMAVRTAAAASVAAAAEALAALETAAPDSELLVAERSAAAALVETTRDAERFSLEADRFGQEMRGLKERADTAAEDAVSAENRRLEAEDALAVAEAGLDALRDGMAASRLAARLEPGLPCPVCGSTHHPAPAGFAQDAGAGAEASLAGAPLAAAPLVAAPLVAATAGQGFSAAESTLSAAKKAAGVARADAAAAAARLAELRHGLAERGAAASGYSGAVAVAEAADAARAARERLARAEEALALESTRARDCARLRAELERHRRSSDVAVAAESKAVAEYSAAEASVAEAVSGAGGSDPRPMAAALRKERDGASAERSRLESVVLAWNKERGDAMARASEASQRLGRAVAALEAAEAESARALADAGFDGEESWAAASLSTAELAAARARVRGRSDAEASSAARLVAAERSVAGVERPVAGQARDALDAATVGYAVARSRVDEAARVERELAAGLDALAGLRAERAALRVRGDRLVAMSRLLNGLTDGRHLSFKIFTLSAYFALVVEKASARLREMSDGRYDMSVTEGSASGRAHVGLDLAVLDSFTGVPRPASSLSGGEKFLASISLALGLSDVIVARAGGAALDSIFIDEGFGSLDDETLDRAMAALDRVRGERVIGIVSHVAELKNRVPARIEVVRSSVGSSLKVVR